MYYPRHPAQPRVVVDDVPDDEGPPPGPEVNVRRPPYRDIALEVGGIYVVGRRSDVGYAFADVGCRIDRGGLLVLQDAFEASRGRKRWTQYLFIYRYPREDLVFEEALRDETGSSPCPDRAYVTYDYPAAIIHYRTLLVETELY
jgi:hypothetical protein